MVGPLVSRVTVNEMPLEEMKCIHCRTVFFGVEARDTHCHICKTIIEFREAFDLADIEINEIDFKRVREPKWEECSMVDTDDWRNYIPERIKFKWSQLPFEARVMAVMFAEKVTRKEEPQC